MSTDLETTLRSAPGWLIAVIAIVAVLALIAAGPVAGLVIQRRRVAELTSFLERPGLSRQHGQWVETGEIDLTSLRAAERARYEERLAQEASIIEEHGLSAYAEAIETDPVIVIRDDRPTTIINKPAWAEEATAGWAIQEPAANVFDAELMEEGDDGLSEAERQFLADPLGSWLLPPLDEYDFLPTADEAVSALLEADLLSGVGMDIDTEWASWNLYEGANA